MIPLYFLQERVPSVLIERKFIKVRSYGEHMLMYSWMGWCSEAVAIKVFQSQFVAPFFGFMSTRLSYPYLYIYIFISIHHNTIRSMLRVPSHSEGVGRMSLDLMVQLSPLESLCQFCQCGKFLKMTFVDPTNPHGELIYQIRLG